MTSDFSVGSVYVALSIRIDSHVSSFLQPENIMLVNTTTNQIKLIDFGFARKYDPDDSLKVLIGTPEFVGKYPRRRLHKFVFAFSFQCVFIFTNFLTK